MNVSKSTSTKAASEFQKIQPSMRVVVKNVCCKFCVSHVRALIENMELEISSMDAGEVYLTSAPSEDQLSSLDAQLKEVGLELVMERKNVLVEKMKTIMREAMDQGESSLKTLNMSDYLSRQLHYNYSYLSNVFSEVEGQTIREFGITLRIDRAKQMLVQERLDLQEIAYRLNYSSVAHLSAQFKKVTGLTTSEYKRRESGASLFTIERMAS
jgi:AraC-like DNA-binding protein